MQRITAIGEEAEDDNEINLTPMLDVVFIMLIFFIVTASFIKEAGIDIGKADGEIHKVPEQGNISVAISEKSEIWIDGRLIDPRAVRANIERLRAENPNGKVLIQADKHSYNATLVWVMDAARQADVYDISLAEKQD